MTNTIKYFVRNRLPDLIRKKLGHRIMATIIVSITLVMGVEIVLDLYFGKKDALEVMETLSLDLAASTYSGIKYPMSVGDSSAVEHPRKNGRRRSVHLRHQSAHHLVHAPGQNL